MAPCGDSGWVSYCKLTHGWQSVGDHSGDAHKRGRRARARGAARQVAAVVQVARDEELCV